MVNKRKLRKKRITIVSIDGLPLTIAELCDRVKESERIRQRAIELWGTELVAKMLASEVTDKSVEIAYEQVTMLG